MMALCVETSCEVHNLKIGKITHRCLTVSFLITMTVVSRRPFDSLSQNFASSKKYALTQTCGHTILAVGKLKEKSRLCWFCIFDGNGLLAHQLIDSRWFEKLLQQKVVENGVRKKKDLPAHWKRSWRNMRSLFRAINLFTSFDLHTLCVWLGSLSIAGGWGKCGALLILCHFWSCCTRVTLAAPRITRSRSERTCHGTPSEKTRNWPTCQWQW